MPVLFYLCLDMICALGNGFSYNLSLDSVHVSICEVHFVARKAQPRRKSKRSD
jgi:hypothetical protein